MFPSDITSLLIAQPGNLVYHLILMLSFALLFNTARLLYSQQPTTLNQRWSQVSLALLLLHSLLLLIGVADWMRWLDGEVLLPAMERWVSFSGLALLIWGFLGTEDERREKRALSALLSLGGIAAIATIYANYFSRPLPFNSTSYDAAWSVMGLALNLTGLLVLLLRRPSIWSLPIAGFMLIGSGYAVHMALGPSELSFAPYLRWGEIMGVPLLTLAAVRSLLERRDNAVSITTPTPPSAMSSALKDAEENDVAHLPQVILDLQAFMASDRLDTFSEMAVRTIGRAMKAELCLLLTPPDDAGRLSIATGFDLISEKHLDGRSLTIEELPIIAQAMERKQAVDLPAQSQAPDITALQRSLFLNRTGAVLFVPILDRTELLGGVVLLSPFARSRWAMTSRRALEKLAQLFAERLRLLQQNAIPDVMPARYYSSEVDATRREVERLVLENTRLTDQLIEATDQASHDLAGFLSNHTVASETIQLLEDEISAHARRHHLQRRRSPA